MAERLLLVCLLLLITGYPLLAQSQTVIWYLPHPDDETIGMADSIYQSVLAGHRNYFVYFTKGENTLARHGIKGPDGQRYQLTREELGQARVREALAALRVLGVEADQVLFFDFPDGALPLAAAQETMRYFATLYPGSIHRTVSGSDVHEDHQTLARALALVSAEEGLVLYPEYFHVYIYRKQKQADDLEKRTVLYPEIKALALAEFSYFNPVEGRYAIAAISTPDLLAGALASPYEYLDPSEPSHPTSKQTMSLGFTLSNLDLGLFTPLSEQVHLQLLYEYKTSMGLAEVNVKLADNIPFIELMLGAGYHLAYAKPYLSASASLGQYFLKLRHVPNKETRFGLGLTTLLHRR